MKGLQEKRVDIKTIADRFRYPSKLWNMIWNTLVGSKAANLPKENRMFLLDQIFSILKTMKSGSVFNENNENFVLIEEKAQNLVDKISWTEDTGLNQLASELNSLLLGYSESLFFIYHKDATEKHGAYKVKYKNGLAKLVVRDGYYLKPNEIWPEVVGFPYNSIVTSVLYDQQTGIGFDIFNNPITNESLVQRMVAFNISASNKAIRSRYEIENVIEDLEKFIRVLNERVEGWSLEEKAKKHIEISWHTLRPGFELLGRSWRTERMKEAQARVDKGYISHYSEGGDLRSFLDPRL